MTAEEAIAAIRDLIANGWVEPCGKHPDGHPHNVNEWPDDAMRIVRGIVDRVTS